MGGIAEWGRERLCVCGRERDDSMLRVVICKLEARHERFVSVSVPRPTLPSNGNGLGPGGGAPGRGGDNRPTYWVVEVLAASGTSGRLAEADTGHWPVRFALDPLGGPWGPRYGPLGSG